MRGDGVAVASVLYKHRQCLVKLRKESRMVGLAMLKYDSGMPISRALQWPWQRQRPARLVNCLFASIVALTLAGPEYVCAQDRLASSSAGAQVAKTVGTIKSLQADSITVAAESGGEVTAKLTGTTKILRVPPGEKDLKLSLIHI